MSYNYVTINGPVNDSSGDPVNEIIQFSPSVDVDTLPVNAAPDGFNTRIINGVFSLSLLATDGLNFYWTAEIEGLPTGAFYLSSANGSVQLYGTLVTPPVPVSALLSRNNLSDINDAAQAVSNLGLAVTGIDGGSAATVYDPIMNINGGNA